MFSLSRSRIFFKSFSLCSFALTPQNTNHTKKIATKMLASLLLFAKRQRRFSSSSSSSFSPCSFAPRGGLNAPFCFFIHGGVVDDSLTTTTTAFSRHHRRRRHHHLSRRRSSTSCTSSSSWEGERYSSRRSAKTTAKESKSTAWYGATSVLCRTMQTKSTTSGAKGEAESLHLSEKCEEQLRRIFQRE